MLNGLDLFSGIGGIAEALGPWVTTRAYCEINVPAQAQLFSRMFRGEIDKAPIWDDIKTLQGEEVPGIDILTGGWPCQGNSRAGLRKGMADDRSGLVKEVTRLIGEVRPHFIFMENVAGVLDAPGDGVGFILNEMARCGYDARWTMLSASEVGASHIRDRFWIFAKRKSVGQADTHGRGRSHGKPEINPAEGRVDAQRHLGPGRREVSGGEGLAFPTGTGRRSQRKKDSGGADSPSRVRGKLGVTQGDTAGSRFEGELQRGLRKSGKTGERVDLVHPNRQRFQKFGQPIPVTKEFRRPECASGIILPNRPPYPGDSEVWSKILQVCPEVEPAVCGMADGIPNRNHRIRAMGNGVDVECAREAFQILSGLKVPNFEAPR